MTNIGIGPASNEPAPPTGPTAPTKTELRARFSTARRALTDSERAAAQLANVGHLFQELSGATTVCAFLPLPSEPMDLSLLDRLSAAGVQVLVPVVSEGAPLSWAIHPGPTVPGPFGIAEPIGPILAASTVTSAHVVLVPAFAVDRQGNRLGRGGGHYDRTLALLGERNMPIIAVLFDGEYIENLPAQAHDRPVTALVTPTTGVLPIGST